MNHSKCPKCGSTLVFKSGISKKTNQKYEMFACPNYPTCDHTENVPTATQLLMEILEAIRELKK